MSAIFKQEDMCPYCHRLLHHPLCTPELRGEMSDRRRKPLPPAEDAWFQIASYSAGWGAPRLTTRLVRKLRAALRTSHTNVAQDQPGTHEQGATQ